MLLHRLFRSSVAGFRMALYEASLVLPSLET